MKKGIQQDDETIPLRKRPPPRSAKKDRPTPKHRLFNNTAIRTQHPIKRILAIAIGIALVLIFIRALKQSGMKFSFSGFNKNINAEQNSGEPKTDIKNIDIIDSGKEQAINTNIILLPPPKPGK